MIRAYVVYQAGIGNVFQVADFNLNRNRDARRLLQSDFRTCEAFARGMVAAGASVRSCHCNMAGDVNLFAWSQDLDGAPSRESFRPVFDGPDVIRLKRGQLSGYTFNPHRHNATLPAGTWIHESAGNCPHDNAPRVVLARIDGDQVGIWYAKPEDVDALKKGA